MCPASNLKSFACSSLSSASSLNSWSYQTRCSEASPSSSASPQPCYLAAAMLTYLQLLKRAMHFSAPQSLHAVLFLCGTPFLCPLVTNSVCLPICSPCLSEAFFDCHPLHPQNPFLCTFDSRCSTCYVYHFAVISPFVFPRQLAF